VRVTRTAKINSNNNNNKCSGEDHCIRVLKYYVNVCYLYTYLIYMCVDNNHNNNNNNMMMMVMLEKNTAQSSTV